MTLALNAHGARLYVNSGSLVLIGGITNISGPGFENPVEDVTAHDDVWATKISTVPDGGEVTIELNLTPENANQHYLWDRLVAGTSHVFEMMFNDYSGSTDTHYNFTAFVTAFNPENPVRGRISATITLAITGAVTQDAGS